MTEEPLTCNDSLNDNSTSGDAAPVEKKERRKKMGVVTCAFFVFVSTSAGPFGEEEAISAGGPLFTLLSLVFCPIFIIVPIIFMVEELGSMMPSNHGILRWTARALGADACFFYACAQQFMNLVDVAVYPALASDFLYSKFAPDLKDNFAATYFLRVAIVIVFGLPNLLPLRDVGILSAIFTVIIIAPFLIGFFAGVKDIDTTHWGGVSKEINVSLLLAVSLWQFTGFAANASIVGECEPRALLYGQLIALFFDAVFYFIPLAVVLQLNTDWASWADGDLVSLFDQIMPGLGFAVAIAGAVSGVALYTSSISTYARFQWGVADLGMAPRILTRTNRYHVPWINVLILMFSTSILILFDLDFLISLEFVFAGFTYIFLVLSFLTMRYTEPDTHRPFRVPGGEIVAILFPLPLVFLVSAVIGSDFTDWRLLVSFLGGLLICCVLFFYLKRVTTPEQLAAQQRLISSNASQDEMEAADNALLDGEGGGGDDEQQIQELVTMNPETNDNEGEGGEEQVGGGGEKEGEK